MPRKSVKKGEKSEHKETHREKLLEENFVSLQKVFTNLAIKFETLSDQIAKLLEVFEISARSFIEKQKEGKFEEKDERVIEKLDDLIDQNKTIADALSALAEHISQYYNEENYEETSQPYAEQQYDEEYSEEPVYPEQAPPIQEQFPPTPRQTFPRQYPQQVQQRNESEYQPSQMQPQIMPPQRPSYSQQISQAIGKEPKEQQNPAPKNSQEDQKRKSRLEELREKLRPKPLPRY